MRIALDTNVLAYAEGMNGAERQADASRVLRDLAEDELVIPAQALAGLFTLLTRKARRPVAEVRAAVLGWHDACLVADTSSGVLLDAMELVVTHQFALWDAIMLAAAAASGCRLLVSEDMQDGFTWRGVTIRNLFANAPGLPDRTAGGRSAGDVTNCRQFAIFRTCFLRAPGAARSR